MKRSFLSVLLSLVLVLSLCTPAAFADDTPAEDPGSSAESTIENAILYQFNAEDKLEYNVVYSGAQAETVTVTDNSGNGIDSIDKLKEVMGVADAPAAVLGTDVGERTLGKAVRANLTLNDNGEIAGIEIVSVTNRPTVGISWKRDSVGNDYKGFAEAYERNGAYAVFLPQLTTVEEAQAALNAVNGIFVTGGEDWNPKLYNQTQSPHGSSGYNDARDTSDILLMQQAMALDVPMLAVCRGEQGFNVAMGGALVQDIPYYLGQKVISGEIAASRVTGIVSGKIPETVAGYADLPDELKVEVPDTGYTYYDEDGNRIGSTYNRQTGEYAEYDTGCEEGHLRVQIDGLIHSGGTGYHTLAGGLGNDSIAIDPNSKWLYDIFGTDTLEFVATAHHQAADPENIGNGLTVVARSSDGIVEALEYQSATFALALQWHPERDALRDTRATDVDQDLSNAPLAALVKYAGVNRSSRPAESVEDAILYQINDENKLEYNVVYSGALIDGVTVTDETRTRINSIDKLQEVMGVADAPEAVLGTDKGERTLGKAVRANLTLNADGDVIGIEVTSVKDRPTIGISWKRDSVGNDYKGFAEAYERNGAYAVFLPQLTTVAEARRVLKEVNGIFVTGGEDWNPKLYNQIQSPHGSSGYNDARDTSDILLMQQAMKLDVPMLAVCRGEQGFNVAMGGALVQDIPYYLGQKVISGEIAASRVTGIVSGKIPETVAGYADLPDELKVEVPDTGYTYYDEDGNRIGSTYDRQTGEYAEYDTGCEEGHLRVQIDGLIHSGGTGYHTLAGGLGNDSIAIDPNSKWLYDIFGTDTLEFVATAHHQAADPEKLGNGLTVVARSSDGIVEALEYQSATFALALQWHPERDALRDTRATDVDQDLSNAPLAALVKYAGVKAMTPDTPSEPVVNPVTPAPEKKGFTDVKAGDWFYDDVQFVAEKGLMNGTSETTFSPLTSISRGMVVTTLYRLEGEPAVTAACPFGDVAAGKYYEKAVIWAAENKIVNGYSNGNFGPEDTVTREQLAAIFYRYAQFKGYDVSVGENTNILSYNDAFSISEYAIPAIQWACGAGLMQGDGFGNLMPAKDAARAEVAAFLHRLCEKTAK